MNPVVERSSSVSEAFAIAHRHYDAHDLRLAEAGCRQVLQQDPNDAGALHLLAGSTIRPESRDSLSPS